MIERKKHAPLSGAILLAILLSLSIEAGGSPDRWEGDIRKFEENDRTNPPPPRPIIFTGSSSIRMWERLAEDFPDQPVINRGFGGCEMQDVVFYANRIILPYHPRMVVIYAGDNDLANGKTPEIVLADCEALVKRIHESDAKVRIGFILVKPSPSRWHLETAIRQLNQMIKEFCSRNETLFYVDVFKPMLDVKGMPKKELFLEDQLHMNLEGYRLWRDLVSPFLEDGIRSGEPGDGG